jgi:hypothetical protein
MKAAYKRRPHDFKRRILERHTSISYHGLLEKENKWLAMIREEELCIRYYNLNKDRNHWRACDNTKTIREKISIKTKEAMQRPEIREKYLEGLKIRDITNVPRGETHWSKRDGYISPRKGASHTDEARQKIKEARAKQVFSPESIAKRAEALKATWARKKANLQDIGRGKPKQ